MTRWQPADPERADGNVTHFAYDAANRLDQHGRRPGHTTTLCYDADGNRTSSADPLGHTKTTQYDPDNRQTKVTTPTGTPPRPPTTRSATGLGHRRQRPHHLFTYDRLNRLVGVTDAAGGHASYAYDAVGNMTNVTDPNGHTTTTTYDVLNRAVSEIDPLTHVQPSTYDAVGNLLTRPTPGVTTSYAYDAANRLLSATYAEAGSATPTTGRGIR